MIFRLKLFLLFLGFAGVMILLRDVRVPLDGSAYALGVQRLAAADLVDVFRWSHVLHVPFLFFGYRLVDLVWNVDVLAFYQGLDIMLGAGGLCLLFLLLRRVGCGSIPSALACVFVLFSWVFWIEAVTADEKMLGFFFVLVYLNLLHEYLGFNSTENKNLNWVRAGALGTFFALSFLFHASAILVLPLSVYLVISRRAFRFGVVAGLVSAVLVLGTYVLVLNRMGTTGWDDVVAYFSSGVSRYSIAATGFTGMVWANAVAKGITKLLWAVFLEDGKAVAFVMAGLSLLFLAVLAAVAWLNRQDRHWRGFLVFFLTVVVFGMTYAPDAPDSYFLMLIPLSLFFAKALTTPKFKYPALVFGAILIVSNLSHYIEFSTFRDEGVDRRYQEAIGNQLSQGDVLVVLDADMGMDAGTQTIIPIHAYFNSNLEHIPSSSFFNSPTDERFIHLARQGRLFIEGICFEDFHTRLDREVEDNPAFRELARVYNLELEVIFSEYSTLFHRSYKNVYRVSL